MEEQNFRTCSVCFDEMKEPAQVHWLPCAHGFHHGCIQPWLNENTKCPVCKTSIHVQVDLADPGRIPPEYANPPREDDILGRLRLARYDSADLDPYAYQALANLAFPRQMRDELTQAIARAVLAQQSASENLWARLGIDVEDLEDPEILHSTLIDLPDPEMPRLIQDSEMARAYQINPDMIRGIFGSDLAQPVPDLVPVPINRPALIPDAEAEHLDGPDAEAEHPGGPDAESDQEGGAEFDQESGAESDWPDLEVD
jgi:hypothetical protein